MIRVLLPSDAEAFQALRLKGLHDTPEAFGSDYSEEVDTLIQTIAERLTASGDRADNVVFGAFEPEDRLAGVAGVFRERGPKHQHKATIWGMFVVPEFRRRGLGRALLRAAVWRGSEMRGVRQIRLTVATSNRAARALYLSEGFTPSGIEVDALKVHDRFYDLELMVLRVV